MTDPVTLDTTSARRLDGNAAGGILGEVFAVDVTAALSRCVGCGATSMLGAHLLYSDAPALVLRCPHCTGVVLRIGSRDGRILLDLSGSQLLEVPVPASPGGGPATEDGSGGLG